MASITIYGYDTVNEVVQLTYSAAATILVNGVSTAVAQGDPVKLDGYDPTGFYGQARAFPGSEFTESTPDSFAIDLDVSLNSAPLGKLTVTATSAETGSAQAAGFPHGSAGLLDIYGTETGTLAPQLLWQGTWRFFHSATQPASSGE